LSNLEIVENQPNGSVVGVLFAVDADAGDSHFYTLVSGAGSAANRGFYISGNQLRLNCEPNLADGPFLNFEKQASYPIRFRATDQSSQSIEREFVITMQDDRTEDADHDGLSESEEEQLHGTSDSLYDTDGDGLPTEPLRAGFCNSPHR